SCKGEESHYVAKIAKDPREQTAQYWIDVMMQSEAKQWAIKFNGHNPPKKVSRSVCAVCVVCVVCVLIQLCAQVDFLAAFVLELIDRPDKPVCAVERYVEGEYVKVSCVV